MGGVSVVSESKGVEVEDSEVFEEGGEGVMFLCYPPLTKRERSGQYFCVASLRNLVSASLYVVVVLAREITNGGTC